MATDLLLSEHRTPVVPMQAFPVKLPLSDHARLHLQA